ncbi:MAG: hypothetical protein LBI79_01220 [Nitrososphaerota archaeon]|nr:hypothetical protein [Nitrososphaerota archaeon]
MLTQKLGAVQSYDPQPLAVQEDGFKVMLHRARKDVINPAIIEKDLKLIEKLLAKAGTKP